MRGCNLKWSVYSSIEGLVSREGHYCTLGEVWAHTTHEYLRTNWDSSIWNPRGVEAGPHILAPALLHSLPTLTSATLLHFFCFHPHTFSFSPLFFSTPSNSVFPSRLTLARHLFFLWFLRAQRPLRQMKGWALVFSPSRSVLPSQHAASARRRLRCGRLCGSWFFFCPNHSQRADHGLIWFFTVRPYFSHQRREWPLKPSPPHFWSNLHHMPLMGDEPTGGRASL